MRRRWQIDTESLGATYGSHGRFDILITEPGAAPLVIEHEPLPAQNVENEARDRLGLPLRDHSNPIQAAIALRSPADLRQLPETQLADALRACADFEYALYRGQRPADAERWPARGWLRGSLQDLALLAQQAMRPSEEIEKLAEILERDIELACQILTEAYPPDHAQIAALFAEHLRNEDISQTRRMAMAILANALIFQQSLAGHEDYAEVRTPEQLYSRDQLHKTEILQDWDAILRINYYPIFHVAREILLGIDNIQTAHAILNQLFHIIQEIVLRGAARSHDLVGFVFQRLIADREFLATFYTRPESAALLAALALPQQSETIAWENADVLCDLSIADFACGTGTLLAAVYQRLGALHEIAGGKARAIHRGIIENVLIGCDVLPLATHLTLSMLASAYPEEKFDKTIIVTSPYGVEGEGNTTRYRLGSLDLLELESVTSTLPTQLPLLYDHGIAVGGTGEVAANIPHGGCDLIIMNPPFTRPNNKKKKVRPGVYIPAFAALGTSPDDQRQMKKRLSQMAKGTVYHGQAGMGSAFVALAEKKLRPNGTLALVLPLVSITGISWEKFRLMLREKYSNIIVVTIAGEKARDKAFSADTGLGECLIIAQRGKVSNPRTKFVTLNERPRSDLDGLHIAHAINAKEYIHRLEDGPYGGAAISVGEDEIGQILDFPIPESGPWQLAGIADFSIAQMVYQLVQGRLWFPRKPTNDQYVIPITTLSNLISEDPPHHSRIECWRWPDKTRVPSAPFEIHTPPVNAVPTYPTLWGHDAPRERCMEIVPDSEAITLHSPDALIRENIKVKAEKVWNSAVRVHHNRDFRFNSQSLTVANTTVDCIGGRAWPSIIFPEGVRRQWENAHAVWGNSTLGILCFWWQANRQQGGRGVTTVTAIPALPTLDLRRLSPAQLAAASQIFDDHKQLPMLPVHKIYEDNNRAELDRRLFTEVLGLPGALCKSADSPLALLRRKLALEPSIHGGKSDRLRL